MRNIGTVGVLNETYQTYNSKHGLGNRIEDHHKCMVNKIQEDTKKIKKVKNFEKKKKLYEAEKKERLPEVQKTNNILENDIASLSKKDYLTKKEEH